MALNYRDAFNAKSLSASDKQEIQNAYRTVFKKELNINTKCRSCYNDALLELINSDKKGYQLLSGVVIIHEGVIYTRHSEILPPEIIELHKDKMIKL